MEITVINAVTNKESYIHLFTYKNYIEEEIPMKLVALPT